MDEDDFNEFRIRENIQYGHYGDRESYGSQLWNDLEKQKQELSEVCIILRQNHITKAMLLEWISQINDERRRKNEFLD